MALRIVSADGMLILDIFSTRLQAGHESEPCFDRGNHFIYGCGLL
ncbi:hypothetical protein [Bacillus subtilis]